MVEFVDSAKPLPAGSKICLSSELNEKQLLCPTPVYSSRYTSCSGYDSMSLQSEPIADQTLPEGFKHSEIQDPTNPISVRKTSSDYAESSSDEAISNMSKIVRQTEDIEYEDVIPALARP